MVDATVAMSKIDISTPDIAGPCKRLNKRNYIPLIQTRIKCVMTAIRRFHYEKVTNASSDVCIHHDVVLRLVGYTPEQVSAALFTPDKLDVDGRIWKAMMAFVEVLCDFQGTLLVEMNRNSTVPVALEMNNETVTFDNSCAKEPLHSILCGSDTTCNITLALNGTTKMHLNHFLFRFGNL
ncbi:hypothetical protein MKW98_004624 [Papaver atlanticum]|uniref:RecQ-mediated genome instability protein 1 C-terminal OB-fold domain-containing protein n=1 Tax=Papaver atlanticum TaxID=357466 RepID=A0AAD4SNK6_9MAGN|nr:hypothetical protein MKW98_004624 [Papaver atlanticum]